MSTTHTVQEGDHLFRIAHRYGFLDYRVLWDHPQNAALKALRKTPHILFPGDKVFIPDRAVKTEAVSTTATHAFRVPSRKLKLRIAVRDLHGRPAAGVKCKLEVEGASAPLTTDVSGIVEQEIPPTALGGSLLADDIGLNVPLRIGFLDPIEEDTGWQGRLINLGYLTGPIPNGDPYEVRSALEEFQCDHGLPLTGRPDSPTRDKLKDIHGC